MEVGHRFYSPEYLWQWWKRRAPTVCWHFARVVRIRYNYFIDCILLVILYVEVNGLELSNFPRVSQLVNAGATIQIEVFWLLQAMLFNHSSLPFPWEIIFISLVFFKANKFDKQSFFWTPAAVWTQIDISRIWLAVPRVPQEMFPGWLHPGICDGILP